MIYVAVFIVLKYFQYLYHTCHGVERSIIALCAVLRGRILVIGVCAAKK